MNLKTWIVTMGLVGLMTVPAFADSMSVGVPVAGFGSSSPLGCPSSNGLPSNACIGPDGHIRFFAGISPTGTGTYLVDNSGEMGVVPDTVTVDGGVVHSSGYLDLFLYFAPLSNSGPHIMNIWAADLDFIDANDPNFTALKILETLEFFIEGQPVVFEIDDINDPGVSGDHDNQMIVFNLDGLAIDFEAGFVGKFRVSADIWVDRNVINTYEDIMVTITAVPEPATLTFLGIGLLGGAAFRKRFKP